jgi:alpha-glucosidase
VVFTVSIRDLPLILASLSVSQVLRALGYAVRRTWLNASYAARLGRGPTSAVDKIREAEIHRKQARFSFAVAQLEIETLAEDLLRITWTPGDLPPAYAIDQREWPGAEASWNEAAGGWQMGTGQLRVRLAPDGAITFRDAHDRTLLESMPPVLMGAGWLQPSVSPKGERFYGLGERAAPLDLRGGRYRMWNTDPAGLGPGSDPLYLCVPVYIGLHRAGSYLVFHENTHDGEFDFSRPGRTHVRFASGALRYYLIPGPPARALERYTELTGRPPLPPRWALGHHHSRWGWRGQKDVTRVVGGFAEHDLALDALHLDIDHMQGFRVLTVDRESFPDMQGLAQDLAKGGIRLVSIVNPGVKADPAYDLFTDGNKRGAFCRLPDGGPVIAPVWAGWSAFPDFTDERVRTWWGERYARLVDLGVSGVWHDMNEPAAFAAWGDPTLPLCTRHAFEGAGGDHARAHNVYGLQMARAGYEGLRRLAPDRRPFILTRSGWAGIQRYAWTWTGDTHSDWESLRQCIPTVLGLSLSGIPYSGPDIGGFSGHPDAELFVRWFQLATFMPFFRNHSAIHTPRREPWLFGEQALGIIRQHLRLRHRLMPYLYTLAWQASRTGQPIVRPVFWNDLDRQDLWAVDDSFLLGDDLLVAPVLVPGARRRAVQLPGGLWFGLKDDLRAEGPGTTDLDAELESIPVLARGGSILPTMEGSELVLNAYPDREGLADSVVYLDAGDGFGDNLVISSSLRREERTFLVEVRARGSHNPGLLSMEVALHGTSASNVWVDNRKTPFDGTRASFPAKGDHRLRFE